MKMDAAVCVCVCVRARARGSACVCCGGRGAYSLISCSLLIGSSIRIRRDAQMIQFKIDHPTQNQCMCPMHMRIHSFMSGYAFSHVSFTGMCNASVLFFIRGYI